MFLQKTLQRNPGFVRAAIEAHQAGQILPDTYVIDTDTFRKNAAAILAEAKAQNIELYYMLKQVGRNPYLAHILEELGYKGAVVVDWKEADVAMQNGCHIAHAGHLVQPPQAFVKKLVAYGVDYMTVYSVEKLQMINEAAAACGKVQKIMVRVIGEGDTIYSGQTAGFYLEELPAFAEAAKKLQNIDVAGVTSFPCFLYSEVSGKFEPQQNIHTVQEAKKILEGLGFSIRNVNTPSATCTQTIAMMREFGTTSAEPGHGLTGTTPWHAVNDGPELPCALYLSEVSHNLGAMAYAFGGGYYRRGHLENAIVGTAFDAMRPMKVVPPSAEAIDYHIGLTENAAVGETVIFASRFQVFVNRSDVCLMSGIKNGNPKIECLYDALGRLRE